jgi:hypothetical protein
MKEKIIPRLLRRIKNALRNDPSDDETSIITLQKKKKKIRLRTIRIKTIKIKGQRQKGSGQERQRQERRR